MIMASPRPDDLLAIAHLVRPHGVRGEISAIPLAPPVVEPAVLIQDRVLTLRDPGGATRTVVGSTVRFHQDRWLITLQDVESMDDANLLRGVDLCLRRDELPRLPEGWFWEDDLQRCTVVDATLGELGGVKGLNTSGYQPQLEVLRPGGAVALIPWVRAFITDVDLAAQVIRTALPAEFPGLE